MEKLCKRCDETKSLDQFARKAKSKDGRQTFCKICTTSVAKQWYKDNKDKPEVARRLNEYNKKIVKETKEYLDSIKSKSGCLVCKENDACCLDWHHLRDKEDTIYYLRQVKNKKRLLAELAKCVVLCSNCHRKLHAGRFSLLVSK